MTDADTYEQHQQPRLEIIGDDFNSDSQSLAARCLKSNPCNFVNCACVSVKQSMMSGLGGRSNLGATHRTHRGEDVSVDHVFTRLVHNNEDETDEKSLNNKASVLSESSSSLNGVESASSTAHLQLGYLDDKGTRIMDCRRGKCELEGESLISDHRPVIATLEWPDNNLNGISNNNIMYDNNDSSSSGDEGLYVPLDPLEPPWGICTGVE